VAEIAVAALAAGARLDDPRVALFRRPVEALIGTAPAEPGVAQDPAAFGPFGAAVGEGLLRLLELAADRPATVFEDLYWADPDTRSVVEYLADHIHGRPAAVGDRASRRSSVARTSEQLTLARTRVKLQPRPAETVPGVLA
jgi:hypothetical protein